MATFRLQITSLARRAARRATAGPDAARQDVMHSEIVLPARLEGDGARWARDRSRLWKAAEQAESRRTSRVAREFQVPLPRELSAQQRLSLARAFAHELADRYGIAVDLSIHAGRPGNDPRNVHAHLLTTTREVTSSGLGARAALDRHLRDRLRLGLPSPSQEFIDIRARWATLTHEALREAGPIRRAGPRSLEEIRGEAARTWLQMRQGQPDPAHRANAVQEPALRTQSEQAKDPQADRAADDDYSR